MAAPSELDDLWGDSDDDLLVKAADDIDQPVSKPVSKQKEDVSKETVAVVPLRAFRPGYLWVSDLTRQNWCEQQLHYTFTIPTLVEEKPVMTAGSNLHLARELAVHDVVSVKVSSSEDIWAIKLLNLLSSIQLFLNSGTMAREVLVFGTPSELQQLAVHDVVSVKVSSSEDIWAIKLLNLLSSIQLFLNSGTMAREVPVFGAPFGQDIFIVGLIDELRFDPDTFHIDLQELKTRKFSSYPSKSQQSQHRLQVMLYKKLFDDLVKGVVSKETVARHLKLDLNKEFGKDVQDQVESKMFVGKNLDGLMDLLFQKMQCLTLVNEISIEYVHQETNKTLFHTAVPYDETELESLFKRYINYWRGERASVGVEIEEAWKCQSCDFAEVCDWRKRKAEEYGNKNCKH